MNSSNLKNIENTSVNQSTFISKNIKKKRKRKRKKKPNANNQVIQNQITTNTPKQAQNNKPKSSDKTLNIPN